MQSRVSLEKPVVPARGTIHEPTRAVCPATTQILRSTTTGSQARLKRHSAAAHLENITPRQQDVLNHLITGMSNKETARALSVSESAVKFHIASLCGRLGAKNRTEIAARASRLLPASDGAAATVQAAARQTALINFGRPWASPEEVIASLHFGTTRNAAGTAPRLLAQLQMVRHFGLIHAIVQAGAFGLLGAVKRQIRVADKRLGLGAMPGGHGNAHADAHREL